MKDFPVGSLTSDLRKSFALPARFITESTAIFGIKGAGKSSVTRTIAEGFVSILLPVTVVDPKGDFWGIVSDAEGTGPGLPFVILGGDHATDGIVLEHTAGELIADLVVDSPGFYILDLSDMRKGQQRRFYTDFAERLYFRKSRNRTAMMLIVDEADLFAPQSTFSDRDGTYTAARMVGASEDIVRRGRQRGIGSMWPTQRPASLHTGVRSQCSTVIVLRVSGKHELAAIDDWVKSNGTDEQRNEMMARLASQETGVGYVWSPHFLKVFVQVKFHLFKTFDSFATPEPGAMQVEPTARASVDLDALRVAMSETIERTKSMDPKALNARIRELEVQLAETDRHVCPVAEAEPQVQYVDRPVPYVPDTVSALHGELLELEGALGNATRRLGNVLSNVEVGLPEVPQIPPRVLAPFSTYKEPSAPVSTTPSPPRSAPLHPQGDGEKLPLAQRKILTALANYPEGRTVDQLAVICGYALGGGGFNNALGALRSAGYITRGTVPTITDLGLMALGPFEQLPRGRALLDHWLSQKRTIGGRAGSLILEYVYSQHPRSVPQEEILGAIGYKPGGGFNNALGRLRTLELVERGKDVKASDLFFEVR